MYCSSLPPDALELIQTEAGAACSNDMQLLSACCIHDIVFKSTNRDWEPGEHEEFVSLISKASFTNIARLELFDVRIEPCTLHGAIVAAYLPPFCLCA